MSTPPTQDQAESPVQRVVDHIVAERFTGVLRVRAREADGEVWFLAGIQEDARFGMSKGDEAYNRLLKATDPVFEAEQRFPSLTGGFKKSLPATGTFAEVQPVDLMRYCETFALTCVLDLVGKKETVRITYRTGELLSADAGSGGDEALASLLESNEGSYKFEVPPFELPTGTKRPRLSTRPGALPGLQSSPPAPLVKPSLAERVDQSLSADGGEAKKRAELAAEAKRKSDAEAETRRRAEAEKEAQRQVEVRRQAEAEAAQRYAEAQRQAQALREAEEQRQAEALRIAEEEREAEELREAEARRQAEEQRQTEAQRQIEEVEREAEAKRKAELRDKSKAAAQPRARAERTVERNRSTSTAPSEPRNISSLWMWLILALVAAAVVHFFFQEPP